MSIVGAFFFFFWVLLNFYRFKRPCFTPYLDVFYLYLPTLKLTSCKIPTKEHPSFNAILHLTTKQLHLVLDGFLDNINCSIMYWYLK